MAEQPIIQHVVDPHTVADVVSKRMVRGVANIIEQMESDRLRTRRRTLVVGVGLGFIAYRYGQPAVKGFKHGWTVALNAVETGSSLRDSKINQPEPPRTQPMGFSVN